MPPKRKLPAADCSGQWYRTVPGRKGSKWYYKPGCASCGCKTSARFQRLSWSEVERLQLLGLNFQFGAGSTSAYICNVTRLRWREAGCFGRERETVGILADYDTPEDISAMSVSIPTQANPETSLESPTLADYRPALLEFSAVPFKENPFVQMDEFISQNPRLYELKASVFSISNSHSATHNDRKKRGIIFSICYDAWILDRKNNYIKRYLGQQLHNTSYTTQRLFSRMGICYHPSKSIERANNLIADSREKLIKKIITTRPLPVVTIDDFHWCHIRALPATANAPGKFTTAHTAANYGVKLHPSIRPLSAAFADATTAVLKDLDWVTNIIVCPTVSYAELRQGAVLSKKLYAYSISTKAASQKDFHLIGSDANPLKSAADLIPILENVAIFLAKVPWRFYTFPCSAGDFYIWMYASKLFNAPKFSSLKPHVLTVPDLMHISLNVQEAILIHAWCIIHPLWQECRKEIISNFESAAATNGHATAIRKAMISSLIWVFEEAIPLAVDAPYLLASGDIDSIKNCLQRLYHLFVRLEKKNYVNIVLFMCGFLEKLLTKMSPEKAAAIFSVCSSEVMEVFQSVLRPAIRFQHSDEQVSRKALLITAMKDDSAIAQLAAMTEREKEFQEQAVSFTIEGGVSTTLSPLESAMEKVVPGMVRHLRAWFSTLFEFSFDVVGKNGKLAYSSSTLAHYTLTSNPTPPLSPSPSPSNSLPTPLASPAKGAKGLSVPKKPQPVVLAIVRETLIPLQLRRQTFAKLGNEIDISQYQVLPPPKRSAPLADITNCETSSPRRPPAGYNSPPVAAAKMPANATPG
ncbi:hypothetical protein DFS34DRAFT_610580 [Phlyctochytrium arcticum]|nr:hypothetical protein DFS34DRAFT_610580 [Phlyctochytrium arcticum]